MVKCKLIFTIKYKLDGMIERYKVRLVAKKFTHTYGLNYFGTFALVVKINISIDPNHNLVIQEKVIQERYMHMYQQLIGRLIYPFHASLHIYYAVSTLR